MNHAGCLDRLQLSRTIAILTSDSNQPNARVEVYRPMFTLPKHRLLQSATSWSGVFYLWLATACCVLAGPDATPVPASTAPLTNVEQIYKFGAAFPGSNCTVRLEGVICCVNQSGCLLQDQSGAIWIDPSELNTNLYKPGQQATLTGVFSIDETTLRKPLLVDNDLVHSAAEQSGTTFLKAGRHSITVGYFNTIVDAVLDVSYQGPNLLKQKIPDSALHRSMTGTNAPGLQYRYFEGQWDQLPNFNRMVPAKTGFTNNFDVSVAAKTEYFGLVFSGFVDIPEDGPYTFSTLSDDGSRLWLGAAELNVTGTNAIPIHPIHPGQQYTSSHWGEVEATVSFVAGCDQGVQLELNGEQRQMMALVQGASPDQMVRYSGKRIRAVGVSGPAVNDQGERVVGRLWVPDSTAVSLAKPSPAEWLALPSPSIRTVTATHSGQPAKKLKQYALTTANDYPSRDPKDWELLGSNDGGAHWTIIDERRGETFTDRYQRRIFEVTNDVACNCFRLKIKSISGIRPADVPAYQFEMIQLSEIELIGSGESEAEFDTSTEKIISAAGDFPPAETKEAAFDGNVRTKWLDRTNTSWIQVQYAWVVIPGDHAVKIQGRVVEQRPGSLLVRDGDSQLRVMLSHAVDFYPGQEIQATGFLEGQGSNQHLTGTFVQAKNTGDDALSNEPQESGVILTNAAQVLALSRKEQKRNFEVRLQGVVTCYIDAGERAYLRTLKTMQDGTGGVALHWGWSGPGELGDLVEVKGYVEEWANAPVIAVEESTVLGRGFMPKPAHPSWEALRTGEPENQWIELHGVVHSATNDHFLLKVKGGQLTVRVTPCDPKSLQQWVDASVTVRGVYHVNYNRRLQILSFTLEAPGMEFVQVDRPAPGDPFALPAQLATNLLRAESMESLAHRAKVAGVVTFSEARSCYLMDQSGVVQAQFIGTNDLNPGDLAELVGFPDPEGQIPALLDSLVRKTGTGAIPAATHLSYKEVAQGNREGQRIKLDATCLGQDIRGPYQVLELLSERQTFRASMASARGKLPTISPGTRIDVSGVCRTDTGTVRQRGQSSTSFELMLTDPSDIVVLQRPPWWTWERAVTLFVIMGAVLGGAVIWIRTLHHKVDERTQALQEEIEERKQIQDKLETEIEERTRLELEKERINKELLETSRRAGMAEVASGVLHNVGNVLNSVNVSASLIADKLQRSKAVNVGKVAALLSEHANNLEAFLIHDERGKKLPGYLAALSDNINRNQKELESEMDSLRTHVDHIKQIVSMQQNYARVAGVMESVSLEELVEDALKLASDGGSRHAVQLKREYGETPRVATDKHKVLQILVNLVKNAKHACEEMQSDDKRVIVRTWTTEAGRIMLQVADNGVGISPENLTRIFNYGFTTRKSGHGFGLHSGALAAKELGGSLTVQSEGPGKGATFTLELPVQQSA